MCQIRPYTQITHNVRTKEEKKKEEERRRKDSKDNKKGRRTQRKNPLHTKDIYLPISRVVDTYNLQVQSRRKVIRTYNLHPHCRKVHILHSRKKNLRLEKDV
jgi:hypothetical protein